MKKLKLFFSLLLVLLAALPSLCQAASPRQGLTLEQVMIVSRHNIRAPYSDYKALRSYTTRPWYPWTVERGELSPRGSRIETSLGLYFQSYLTSIGFMPQNWEPEEGQVRFFANSYQRTIATAQYFSSGMLPIANVTVERRYPLGKKDPVFSPRPPVTDPAFREAIITEMSQGKGTPGLQTLGAGLEPNISLLAELLDTKNSAVAKNGSFTGFHLDDYQLTFTKKKYRASGSLQLAADLTDALIMQYYEDSTDGASFGRNLTEAQWRQLGMIFDRATECFTSSPSFAGARNYYLLREMISELTDENRRFSFLCGHDTNLQCLLTNLRIKKYEITDSPVDMPIGAKMVFETWQDSSGALYIDLRLVYPGVSQIRTETPFTLQNPPRSLPLELEGLTRGQNGLYSYEEVLQRLEAATEFPFEM